MVQSIFHKLWRACSRLHRSGVMQVNTYFAECFEIYKNFARLHQATIATQTSRKFDIFSTKRWPTFANVDKFGCQTAPTLTLHPQASKWLVSAREEVLVDNHFQLRSRRIVEDGINCDTHNVILSRTFNENLTLDTLVLGGPYNTRPPRVTPNKGKTTDQMGLA